VLVVQVDVIGAEPGQRGVAGGDDVLRPPVDTDPGAVLAPLVAELGGQHHLVPAACDGPADQQLIGKRAVHVGGVQEGAAKVDAAVDGGDGLGFVGGAVELGHAHATEADGRDGQ
jgi:hypothetical protein